MLTNLLTKNQEKQNLLNQNSNKQSLLKSFIAFFDYFTYSDRRYVQPFKALAKIINSGVNFLLFVGQAGIYTGLNSVFVIASWIEKSLVNFLTNGQYNQELDHYLENSIASARSRKNYMLHSMIGRYIMKQPNDKPLLNTFKQIQATDDEELMRWFLQTKFLAMSKTNSKNLQEDLNQDITIMPFLFTPHLLLSAKAIFHSVFIKPLPGGFFNNTLATSIVRPLKLLISPLFIAAAAAVDAMYFLYTAVLLGTIVGTLAIKATTLLVINAPIHILDAVHSLAGRLNAKKETTETESEDCNDGPEMMRALCDPRSTPHITAPENQPPSVSIYSMGGRKEYDPIMGDIKNGDDHYRGRTL